MLFGLHSILGLFQNHKVGRMGRNDWCELSHQSYGCGLTVSFSLIKKEIKQIKDLNSRFLLIPRKSLSCGLLDFWFLSGIYCMWCWFSSVQVLSRVWLFATPRTAACQASLSMASSQSLLKLMSIESVMPSSHLILCCPLFLLPSIFPSIRVFSNESVLRIRWQNVGVSALASVLTMNIQDWFPLGWTGWISLQSKGLSRVFSNTIVQKHQFFSAQLSL